MLLWLFVIPALLGLFLIIRGWRGARIDDHPLCHGCGYDLIASEGSTRCPECGNDVTLKRSIRIGHRRRRPIALSIGVFVLLSTIGVGGPLAYVMARGVNWNPYKPLWMLRREACGSNWNVATLAEREIFNRLQAGKLSQSQIDSIVNEVLHAQPDPAVAWHPWWGDVIEQQWQAGKVSDATIIQYARTAINLAFSLDLPKRARENAPSLLFVTHGPMRAGRIGAIEYQLDRGPVLLEDGSEFARRSGSEIGNVDSGSSGRGGNSVMMRMPVGKHVATMKCRVRIWPARKGRYVSAFSLGGLSAGPEPARDDQPLADWVLDLPAQVEIIAPDMDIVERVRDDSLVAALRAAVDVRSIQIATVKSGGAVVLADVRISNAPMPVAFDVYLRQGEREWLVADLAASQDNMRRAATKPRVRTPLAGFDGTVQRVDVVLRTNARLAEETGLNQVWDGEIVLKDVPVEHVQRGDR